jgi:CheY-like chemotaxis protein
MQTQLETIQSTAFEGLQLLPEKIRLCVVEECPVTNQLMQNTLSVISNCCTFTDPLAGLEIMKKQPFDVLITGYHMTGMDGIQLIKAAQNTKHINQYILYSSLSEENLTKKLQEPGLKNVTPLKKSTDLMHLFIMLYENRCCRPDTV